MSYLPDIASVVDTTSKMMSYLPDIGVRRRIRYRRFDIRHRIRWDVRCRTYDWQEQYLDLRCDLRCRTFRDIVYDIVG